jgi:NADH-quinone oxidoreductase subunit E
MLSEAEKREIELGIEHLRHKKAAALTALKVVQDHRSWISEESLRDIADFMNISLTELESIATFYNMVFRKPVGRHVVVVCNSISCWVTGCNSIVAALEKKLGIQLGETTEDGMFTLIPSPCLGECSIAPVMMVDEDLYGNLTEEKIDGILASYRVDDD